MGRFETQLVYDVHNLHTQEYLRTFSTMDQVMSYCQIKHKDQTDNPDIWNKEEYEIKTVLDFIGWRISRAYEQTL